MLYSTIILTCQWFNYCRSSLFCGGDDNANVNGSGNDVENESDEDLEEVVEAIDGNSSVVRVETEDGKLKALGSFQD